MLIVMKIGKNLRKLREEKGLSLRELQNEIGISHNTLGAYERDTVQPTIENYFKLIDYFEIPFNYLVYGKKAVGKFIDSELSNLFKEVEELKKNDREIIKKYLKKYLKNKNDYDKLQNESMWQ